MDRKAGGAKFQNYLESFDRKAEGAGSSKDTDRFSGLDIRTAFDNRGDLSKSEGAQMVLDYADKARSEGSKMGGAANDALDKLRGYTTTEDTESNNPDNSKKRSAKGFRARAGNATAGDNSIASPVSNANRIKVDGDGNQVEQNNSVTNTQDFDNRVDNSRDNRDYSMRFYGGSGSGLGKYGGPDDSPGRAQQFIDMYTDSLIGSQRDIRRDYERRRNTDFSPNDPGRDQELNRSIESSIKDSREKSDNRFKEMYGNSRPFDVRFKMPEVPDPITSDTKSIYDDALKKMK